jgi:hypothetical protein
MTSLLFPDCPCPFHPLFCVCGFVCSSAPVNLALVHPRDVSIAFGSRWAGVMPHHCCCGFGPMVQKSLIQFFRWTYLFCALNALLRHCSYVCRSLCVYMKSYISQGNPLANLLTTNGWSTSSPACCMTCSNLAI